MQLAESQEVLIWAAPRRHLHRDVCPPTIPRNTVVWVCVGVFF